jgi:heme/copper-type cytochrome/quinol oxidase subunit 2
MPGIFIFMFVAFVVLVIIFVVTGFLFRGYHLKNANETDFSSHYDSTTNTNL